MTTAKFLSLAVRVATFATIAAVAVSVARPPQPALAAPLDAESCGRLKGDLASLEAGGIRNDMARGPAEAKANLPAARLQQIARLIEIEGQLRFRCPLEKPFVVLKEDPADDGEVATKTPVPKKKVAAKSASDAKKAPDAKKTPAKDAGKAKETTAATPVKKASAPAEPAAKPRPKPKQDDAFRPAAQAPAPAPVAAPVKKTEQ